MTSDGRVEPFRTMPSTGRILVGAPTAAKTALEIARLAHWVRGRGRVLVAAHSPRMSISAAGSLKFRYRTHPSGVAIARVWLVEARNDSVVPDSYASFQITAGTAPTSDERVVSIRSFDSLPQVYIEDCTKTAAQTDLSLDVTHVSGSVVVESVACYELPRAALSRTVADLGLSLDSFNARRPIFEAQYEGLKGLAETVVGLGTRRIAVFNSFSKPTAITSGSYVDLFVAPVRVLPALDRPSNAKRTLTCTVWGRVTLAGTTGEVRFVDGAGNFSGVMSISSTSDAFYATTLDVKCEDPSTSNGLRSGSYDTLQCQIRRTVGAGEIAIEGCQAHEAT